MRAIAIFSPSRRSGKSWLTAALGRSLVRSGWRVAPFQGQTEITHGYRVDPLAEVSHSLAWQAWAARVAPSTGLNPVLLKAPSPTEDRLDSLQMLIQGRGIGTVTRTSYYENYYNIVRPLIRECLLKIQADYDFLLFDSYRHGLYYPIQGDTDQNFEILQGLGLSTTGLLLVDCTHEGEISQLWGLWQRLSTANRKLIHGVIFNQWQGDRQTEIDITHWVQVHMQLPILGFIPPLPHLVFNPESLLVFEQSPLERLQNKLRIQVLQLSGFRDYGDFDPLMSEPSVQLEFLHPADPLGYPDAVIIPHTDEAIAALEELQKYSYPQQLQQYINAGGTVLGMGNGANLLCQKTRLQKDSFQVALNLMPFRSQIHPPTPQDLCETISRFPFPNLPLRGLRLPYDIQNYDSSSGYLELFETPNLGLTNQTQTVWAIYLRNLFDNSPWRRFWLNTLRQKRGLASLPTGIADFAERREAVLEAIANHFENHVDLRSLLPDLS
ncbi:MAG: hypothetical protein VKJ86_09225 [Synechococcus sp.]|nr:hypothetical protein [Synechococcus sp.]